MIARTSEDEIRALIATVQSATSTHERDEMAIPSYLHSNPLIRWLMWRRYETIAGLIDDNRAETAFEFGCGLGLFLPELNRRFERVYATDLFPEFAIALNEKKELKTQFIENIDALDNESLDVIIAADVLEHLSDLSAVLDRFKVKLRSGGTLLISGPTENIIYKLGRIIAGFGDKGDYHHTNIDQLIRDITAFGFVPGECRRLPFPVPPTLFKIIAFRKA